MCKEAFSYEVLFIDSNHYGHTQAAKAVMSTYEYKVNVPFRYFGLYKSYPCGICR